MLYDEKYTETPKYDPPPYKETDMAGLIGSSGRTGGRGLAAIAVVFFLVPLIGMGCSQSTGSMKQKFTPTTRENLGPFADQTISLLTRSHSIFRQDKAILTRNYINKNSAEVQELNKLAEKVDQLLRAIIAYSLEIVTLAESQKEEKEKILAFAEYIDTLRNSASEERRAESMISEERFQQILKSIREQKKLLDALAAAQPLINEAARHGNALLSRMDRQLMYFALSTEIAIADANRYMNEFRDTLEAQKRSIIQGLQLIHDYGHGDPDALDKVLANIFVVPAYLVPDGQLTTMDVRAIRNHLVEELKAIQEISANIDPDYRVYRETHDELDRLIELIDKEIDHTRVAVLIWSRAHLKMASGITDPAKWFDLTNPGGEIFGLSSGLLRGF